MGSSGDGQLRLGASQRRLSRTRPHTASLLSSVSTIWNQRYHIHANLSFAVLVAQVLLLISFRLEPGTVSRHWHPPSLAPSPISDTTLPLPYLL